MSESGGIASAAAVSKSAPFTCQKCRGILEVEGLTEGNLSDTLRFVDTQTKGLASRHPERKNLDESFVVLPSAAKVSKDIKAGAGTVNASMHQQSEILSKLFDVATQKTSVDHPLCQDCAEILHGELQRQLQEAESDRDVYKKKLAELNELGTDPDSSSRYDREIQEATKEEAGLRESLEALEKERDTVLRESEYLKGKESELAALEDKYYADLNEHNRQVKEYDEENSRITHQIACDGEQLTKLKEANVYNDAFHIYHRENFGTINGFRLGRLPNYPVDWPEINAAWGQASLLLSTMANLLNFTFTGYRIIPMGSMSKITDEKNTYNLYGSDAIDLKRLFSSQGFHKGALKAFLACLKQLCEFVVEKDDEGFEIPYPIGDNKIGEIDFKNSKESSHPKVLTKGFKYMLTDMKWLLAWVRKHQI